MKPCRVAEPVVGKLIILGVPARFTITTVVYSWFEVHVPQNRKEVGEALYTVAESCQVAGSSLPKKQHDVWQWSPSRNVAQRTPRQKRRAGSEQT